MKKNKNKGSQQGGFFSSTGLSLNKTPVNPPERERERVGPVLQLFSQSAFLLVTFVQRFD